MSLGVVQCCDKQTFNEYAFDVGSFERHGWYGVFYKLKSAQFIIEKVPTLKVATLKLSSKRGPLYYRKGAHFCPPRGAGDKISIAQ